MVSEHARRRCQRLLIVALTRCAPDSVSDSKPVLALIVMQVHKGHSKAVRYLPCQNKIPNGDVSIYSWLRFSQIMYHNKLKL